MRLGVTTAVGLSVASLVACGQFTLIPMAIAQTSPTSEIAQSTSSDLASHSTEGPAHRTMSSVLIKQIKRTVRFAPMSAQLDAEAMQILAAAAKLVPTSATQVKVGAVGYVQPSAFHGNDTSLATKRARVVAAALRDEGIEGTYSVIGRGHAARRGAEARRVDITISFTATG